MSWVAVVAAVEAVVILAVLTLWWRSARRTSELAATVEDLERRSVRVPRGLSAESAVRGVWEVATAVREKGVGGAFRASIQEIAGWAEVERPALVELAGVDGCVAIVFTDIEGSTRLNERLGDRRWVRLLRFHDGVVTKQVRRHHGLVVKHQGDGYMLAFSTAEQAVRCAISIQRALRAGHQVVRVRIGVHHGSVVHRDNDIFGRNVALASRVAGLADGGEALLSTEVVDQLEGIDDLVARIGEARAVELKGFRSAHEVAELQWR